MPNFAVGKSRRRFGTVAVVAATIVSLLIYETTGNASAAPKSDSKSVLSNAGALAGAATVVSQNGGLTGMTSNGKTRIRLPKKADDGIELSAEQGNIKVSIPDENSISTGEQISTGTLAYSDNKNNRDIAVQSLTDGARTLVTLRNSQAPKNVTYRLTLPTDVQAVPNGGGGFDLVKRMTYAKNGEVATLGVSYGTIAAPWAKDAAGRPVPTSYSLVGSDLVQSIAVNNNTAYPVVADPHFTWGW